MKIKIYDLVKELLTNNPSYRDSDKKLIWGVWGNAGYIPLGDMISYDNFMKAPSHESIRRSRQKCQELHPELRGSKWIQKARAEKAEEKGTFIYREEIREQQPLI